MVFANHFEENDVGLVKENDTVFSMNYVVFALHFEENNDPRLSFSRIDE